MELTVFTPAYNRAGLLQRLYDSLVRQTDKDFMWLIVDDGSTDNTKALVDSFINENEIKIKYIYRENGGKMRAHNDGVRACETKYFLCVDSDDYLVDDAVELLLNKAHEISGIYELNPSDKKCAGIISHKGTSETEILSGVSFPNVQKSTLYALYLNGFKGETTIMFLSDVIKQFPFPEIDNEKYVPEDYIYDKIDVGHEYLILDKVTTVCEITDNGYTGSVKQLKRDNRQAFYLYYEQRARITPMSLLKIKYLGFYAKYARLCGAPVFQTDIPKLYAALGIIASVFINE